MLFGLKVSLTTCSVILTWGTECRSFTNKLGGNSIFPVSTIFLVPRTISQHQFFSFTITSVAQSQFRFIVKQRRTRYTQETIWLISINTETFLFCIMTKLLNRPKFFFQSNRKTTRRRYSHSITPKIQNYYYWCTDVSSNYRLIIAIEFHIL